jgi:hypothetical protein
MVETRWYWSEGPLTEYRNSRGRLIGRSRPAGGIWRKVPRWAPLPRRSVARLRGSLALLVPVRP